MIINWALFYPNAPSGLTFITIMGRDRFVQMFQWISSKLLRYKVNYFIFKNCTMLVFCKDKYNWTACTVKLYK